MFSKIFFHFDQKGNIREKPLELKASHIRSKCFEIETSEYRGGSSPAPSIHICRIYKNLKTDPWNEDGRPPSLMCIMVYPTVCFLGSAIEIIGFEVGNLSWAGQCRPAYSMCQPLNLPENMKWDIKSNNRIFEFENLPKQRIVLR